MALTSAGMTTVRKMIPSEIASEKGGTIYSREELLQKFLDSTKILSRKEQQNGIIDSLKEFFQKPEYTASAKALMESNDFDLPDQIVQPPSQVVDLLADFTKVKITTPNASFAHFPCPAMTELVEGLGTRIVTAFVCDDTLKKYPRLRRRKLKGEKFDNMADLQVAMMTEAQAISMKKALEERDEELKFFRYEPVKCGQCRLQFHSIHALESHQIEPHRRWSKWICSYCGERCDDNEEIIEHYAEFHQRRCRIPDPKSEKTSNDCTLCEQTFPTKGELGTHVKVCKMKFQEGRNLAPTEDDLMHVNRLFWPLNPTQLVRVQKRIVPLRPDPKQQQLKQKMAAVAAGLRPGDRLAMSGAVDAKLVAGPQFRNALAPVASYVRPQIRGMQRSQISLPSRMNVAGMNAASGRLPSTMFAGNVAPLGTLNSLVQQLQRFHPSSSHPLNSNAAMNRFPAMDALGNRPAFQQKPNNGLRVNNPQALPSNIGALHFCELCDGGLTSLDHYRIHLQVSPKFFVNPFILFFFLLQMIHKKLRDKNESDFENTAPLACSRCQHRFYTYEGLERHLLMKHALVAKDLLEKTRQKRDEGKCQLCAKVH